MDTCVHADIETTARYRREMNKLLVLVALAACKGNPSDTKIADLQKQLDDIKSQQTEDKHAANIREAFARSASDDEKLQLKKYATEAYPLWVSGHAGKACPDRLSEIADLADDKSGADSWGTSYQMVCGASAPAAAKGFGVTSAGEDKKFGTPDDIKSWEQ